MWPPLFWILWALILSRGQNVLTTIIWRVYFFLSVDFGPDGVHIPGLFTLGPSWLAVLIYGRMLHTASSYCGPPGVVALVATVFKLRHFMYPYNDSFDKSWAFAWWLLYAACIYAMAPGMSPYWYGMWYAIMSTTAYYIRPDRSETRFVVWAALIIVLRVLIYALYIVSLGNNLVLESFSSNFFFRTWRMSSPVWYPLSSRDPVLQDYSTLCERCDQITKRSNLITGSSLYFTKLVEWHTYWSTKELCRIFGDDTSVNHPDAADGELDAERCGLCSLLWHSMSLSRRECVIASTISREEASATSPHLSLPTNVYDELKVKVWEERPLSSYTYAQLYWGEIAIGARILVHRQKLFADASEAIDQPRTNSILHFEQAKEWLRLCGENHTLCTSKNSMSQELPARLLYVSTGNDWRPGDRPAVLRLVRTIDLDRRPEYLAFSHCWGTSEVMRFKLLASNIERCYEGIDFMRLSQNMQDAITTTLSLGAFSYLWIDSLCIIQQDEKDVTGDETWKRDWEAEAKKMGSVNSGAALTIASTGSSSSDGGCFHARNTQSLKPVRIGVSSSTSPDADWIYARRDDVFDFERNVNLAPLNTRGWVMQERLLSRRILHFGAEMIYWECCGRSASELNPHGYTYKAYPEDFGDWYMPQIPGRMENRQDVERAEREGRGFSWASSEAVRRRPPPVMTDPDNEAAALSTQAGVWQRRRGFWKDVLKRDDEPWSRDEKGGEKGDEKERRVRGGFRATFEALRSKQLHDPNPYAWSMQIGAGIGKKDTLRKTELLVGRHSFSQMWYDIVESYSRGKLTVPADKIIALKGIQDEVAYATGFDYMYGLWRESLVADLLWFAIEGPGQRLRNDLGAPVAPMWSCSVT
ncbi:heterokaryon incompatibility protein-domain-containing protein [Xylaria grammica]|nr:heterokaryon incompatibility protein-domain-containing protein [Xylaria grammica]